jgi:MFS family permease
MLTWALSGVVAAPLLVRWGFRKTALFGATIVMFGFGGLAVLALVSAPHWTITTILALTGFGFGFASMSYLLAAQEAVGFQQRGIVTSATTFFRSIGGALGVGVLGGVFNVLSHKDLAALAGLGVTPAKLLDPHTAGDIPPEAAARAQHVIASGLTWVFIAMAAVTVAMFAVTFWMPARKCEHPIKASEGLEAMA